MRKNVSSIEVIGSEGTNVDQQRFKTRNVR